MMLTIATSKTFVTIFHAESDDGVLYDSDSVWVDGHRVSISVYGQEITAAASFNYLGVWLDSCARAATHLESRHVATLRAGNALVTGTARLPACARTFVIYQWSTLVLPVALYGVELFVWSEPQGKRFRTLQVGLWRRLLNMGGRSPRDAAESSMGCSSCCTIEWRVRRVGLLLRLLNARMDSWHHVALLYYVSSHHGSLSARRSS